MSESAPAVPHEVRRNVARATPAPGLRAGARTRAGRASLPGPRESARKGR